MAELSRHFTGIAVQVERFNNLPAVAGGDRIIQAMQDMMQDMTQQIRAEIQQVRTEVQSVRGTMQAYDANASACLINNYKVRAPTHEIEPLVDVRTGATIPHFPETINHLIDLQRMSLILLKDQANDAVAEANAILSVLGTLIAGNLAAKRACIK
ncbi:hypothetical protein B0T25DRAFT_364226 [Lasiosphaeria hispida]|uniref:Uncharacterized protein n=1 Tax=Lasiosphaeria hispida TaxID=260671 RepID=A0AAJ0M7S8_9PEZI|nr:hypothetical protein B0T25DRAFT_364226 [Lasiosphaeria hispida]